MNTLKEYCLVSIVLVILMLQYAQYSHSLTCQFKHDGHQYDFSQLQNKWYKASDSKGRQYYFGICKQPPSSKIPKDKCKQQAQNGQAMAIQYDNGYCYPVGKTATQTSSKVSDGLKIHYGPISGGQFPAPRELTLHIQCDKNVDKIKIKSATENSNNDRSNYIIKAQSKYACKNTGGGGGGDNKSGGYPLGDYGVGGLILTLVLAAIILYFAVGAIVNYFAFHKGGVEIVPQFNIWKEVALLFKDGIMLPVDLIKDLSGRSTSYSEV